MIIYALPLPTTVIAAGAYMAAQALVDGVQLGEIIGGGIVVSVGLIALRMILQAAKHERVGYLQRITDLEDSLADERTLCREMRIERDAERDLRISLEEAGIADRRRHREAR